MKDGTKTSEFKVIVGAILAVLVALGIITQQDADTTTELIFVAVEALIAIAGIVTPAVAYVWSRTRVKEAHAAPTLGQLIEKIVIEDEVEIVTDDQ